MQYQNRNGKLDGSMERMSVYIPAGPAGRRRIARGSIRGVTGVGGTV